MRFGTSFMSFTLCLTSLILFLFPEAPSSKSVFSWLTSRPSGFLYPSERNQEREMRTFKCTGRPNKYRIDLIGYIEKLDWQDM
uniref:Lipocalin n=1 Tax=Rhipicephalus appendiculatus TaxID=34631 RepID=A0A131YDX2_RHIAP